MLVKTRSAAAAVIDPCSALFIEIVIAFTAFMYGLNAKLKTVKNYRSILLQAPVWLGGLPDTWTPDKWTAYTVAHRTAGGAISTAQHKQIMVTQCIKFANDQDNGFVARILETFGRPFLSPVTNQNRIRNSDVYKIKPTCRAVAFDELQRFLDYLDELAHSGPRREGRVAATVSAVIKTMVAFGMRCMEGRVRMRDFEPVAGAEQYGRFGKVNVVGKSKPYGEPRPRAIYAISYFGDIPAVLEQFTGPTGPRGQLQDDDYLFVTERGTPLSAHYITKIFIKYCKDIGISREATAHGLRRLYATYLYQNGVDLWFISDQLGHENFATTLRYIHFETDFREQKQLEYQRKVCREQAGLPVEREYGYTAELTFEATQEDQADW